MKVLNDKPINLTMLDLDPHRHSYSIIQNRAMSILKSFKKEMIQSSVHIPLNGVFSGGSIKPFEQYLIQTSTMHVPIEPDMDVHHNLFRDKTNIYLYPCPTPYEDFRVFLWIYELLVTTNWGFVQNLEMALAIKESYTEDQINKVLNNMAIDSIKITLNSVENTPWANFKWLFHYSIQDNLIPNANYIKTGLDLVLKVTHLEVPSMSKYKQLEHLTQIYPMEFSDDYDKDINTVFYKADYNIQLDDLQLIKKPKNVKTNGN